MQSSCFKTWLLIRDISGAMAKNRKPKTSNTWAFVFFKKFQGNSDMHINFKKWLQLLVNGSFDDVEFCSFSVD